MCVSLWYRQKEILHHFSQTSPSHLITNVVTYRCQHRCADPGNRTRQSDMLACRRTQLGRRGSVCVPCRSSSFQWTVKPSTCIRESLKPASQPAQPAFILAALLLTRSKGHNKRGSEKQPLKTLMGSSAVRSPRCSTQMLYRFKEIGVKLSIHQSSWFSFLFSANLGHLPETTASHTPTTFIQKHKVCLFLFFCVCGLFPSPGGDLWFKLGWGT